MLLTVEQIECVKLARRDPGTRGLDGTSICSFGDLGRPEDADRIDGSSSPAVVVRRVSRGGRVRKAGVRGPTWESGLIGWGTWCGFVWLRWGDDGEESCMFLNVGTVGDDVDRGDTDGRLAWRGRCC